MKQYDWTVLISILHVIWNEWNEFNWNANPGDIIYYVKACLSQIFCDSSLLGLYTHCSQTSLIRGASLPPFQVSCELLLFLPTSQRLSLSHLTFLSGPSLDPYHCLPPTQFIIFMLFFLEYCSLKFAIQRLFLILCVSLLSSSFISRIFSISLFCSEIVSRINFKSILSPSTCDLS